MLVGIGRLEEARNIKSITTIRARTRRRLGLKVGQGLGGSRRPKGAEVSQGGTYLARNCRGTGRAAGRGTTAAIGRPENCAEASVAGSRGAKIRENLSATTRAAAESARSVTTALSRGSKRGPCGGHEETGSASVFASASRATSGRGLSQEESYSLSVREIREVRTYKEEQRKDEGPSIRGVEKNAIVLA